MSEVLGGGFSSRLCRHIRTELGLAYAVSASWNVSWDRPGSFFIFCNTKSESTVYAVEEILKEVRRITEEPVSAEELHIAKETALNSFIFNFDTTGEIVRRLMSYDYYGYPGDFLDKFKANVGNRFAIKRFKRCIGANTNKARRVDNAVWCMNTTNTSTRFF